MRENTIYILFSILRSVFHGNQMTDSDKLLVTDESLVEVIKLASKHDIAHLVALGVLNNGLANEEMKPQLQQITFQAVYRYEKMNYELQKVCEALEKAEIPFIPLKGSVIRKYYPEPWMRTSCDIDILVHEKDLRAAITYLVETLKYSEHEQNSHDVSLFSTSGTHIELHYDLVEDGWANSSKKILSDVWEYTAIKDGCKYWCELTDGMFYFYHVAHMAKHFQQGGCGIRPFIDLWILDKIDRVSRADIDKLLSEGELLQFSNLAKKLSSVWFNGNASTDPVISKMENYILCGGVYGTLENRIVLQQQKQGGRIGYAFSKIVIPYDTIKFHYPVLQKYRWLTPIMQVRRWFKLVFCGHAKRSMRELSYNKSITKSQAVEMKTFLDEIGL